ncbi:ABC transporter family substrate-binding protein [Spongiactinospora sp. TRM90649]|uniref:ABC transporter family substrate-binding protein n=1 Tax=Spongiactinospora sp. TRM90649 TaxID=3031114 RepID=UPI0023F87746|nr:ABC transporter family substrate-binding protein [Spongiactinospora sp. TRM90649]MDF5755368.1 ABC transporter family substrate-binding protein [Spongiactinospora sp. TRM90649]
MGAVRHRSARRATVLAVVVLVGAPGCGATKNETDHGGGVGVARAIDINAVPREKVREGGTLRWGIDEYPDQWNRNHLDGNRAEVELITDALMPTPFRSDERGGLRADPDYVTEAAVTDTRPRQVVTLTLNPRARWSDGTAVTWADYAAQWQALSGVVKGYRAASTTGYKDIKSVAKGENEYQVVITFARPFADWRSLFTPLYPKSTNGDPKVFDHSWLRALPVSAGPFRFGTLDPAARTVTIVRDPAWWGEPAKLDQIVFQAKAKPALTAAFVGGELDVFDLGSSAADFERVREAPGARVRQASGPDFRHFTFNGESPILSDPLVRRAVAMGLDRRAIAASDLAGLGWPGEPLNNHFFMHNQHGYLANGGKVGRYDVAGARRLLEEAGWRAPSAAGAGAASPAAGVIRQKDGKQLTLRFLIPAGLQIGRSEGEQAQAMLKEIGVNLVLQSVPGDDFFARYIIPGDYDIAPFSYLGTPYPVSSSQGLYADAVTGAGGRRSWNANLARIGSPEIDTAMRRATRALDPGRARALTNRADALIWRQVNVLPLYQRPQNVAVRSNLANVGARGFYDLRYADIGFTG